MNSYIALLRGINVGGNNKLPMRELVETLNGIGLSQVKTYIQSGNVIFKSTRNNKPQLSQEISAAIEQSHGFSPPVLILTLPEFQAAMAANPFPEAEDAPKTLHLYFLNPAPNNPDFAALEAVRKATERYQLIGQIFYLHAPDGIGRSKLAEKVGKGWQVDITARNWRTVSKVMALANSY